MITLIAETVHERAAGAATAAASDENAAIAARLRAAADLLESQSEANRYRVRAYRTAADTLAALERPVREIFEEGGIEGLDALSGVGPGIAAVIAEILITGDWGRLRQLQAEARPLDILQAVPGIGPDLARDINATLHAGTLEALEVACANGRLREVPGIGERRAAAICAALTAMLDRRRLSAHARCAPLGAHRPAVRLLLDVDAEYRRKAAARRLPTIAPKRFNPSGEAWLPILHTEREGWHFTALYSNTARAHELHETRDWVVVYFHDDAQAEGQHTVVTETRGPLIGRRVVRGRGAECQACYAGAMRTGR